MRCGRIQLHLVSTYGMDQSLECRELGREMAICWYRVIEGHKFRRICSQDTASDSSCPADGVSLAMFLDRP